MESYEHGVFISYAWGEKREKIVNLLDKSLQKRGIRIIRDKRELEYKGSIKEFMERIGHGDCIIVVISDKYLRSPNCMFELVEVADNKEFKGRVFPIVLDDANIYDGKVRARYIGYWEKETEKIRKELGRIERGNTRSIDEQLNLYIRIRHKFDELISVLGDMNTLKPSMHRDSNFKELYGAIVKRLEASSSKETTSSSPITGREAPAAPAPAWKKGVSPYPGLRALGSKKDDEKIFFGREAETEDLLRRLEDPKCRFLAVAGASGSGKSSLVRAGLLSRLRNGAVPGSKDWLVVTFKPDELGKGDPFDSLAVALKSPLDMEMEDIRSRLLEGRDALRNLLTAHLADGPKTRRVLIFIDQFEELFTRVADDTLRNQFQNLLDDLTRSPRVEKGLPRIQTVVTIRNDFLQYCVESRILSPVFNRNPNSTYLLSAPGVWQMYEMIAEPARVAGLQFEAGLEGRILQDTASDPGALALMSFSLEKLYEASGVSGKLTFDAYRKFGGVQGAIGTHAAETFAKLPQEAQDALPRVFRELLDVNEHGIATRKRASLNHLMMDKANEKLVRAFDKARLLVSSEGLVEVAHEAIFHSWPKLAKWIRDTQDAHILRRQVQSAAAEWNKKGRKPEYLWPDERLKLVYEMEKQLEPKWNEVEQEFIRSEAERLLEEIEIPETDHQRRSEIGERLARIGDPRPGVGLVQGILPLRAEEGKPHTFNSLRPGEIRLWGDKPEHVGLPDIIWLPVEGGTIQIKGRTFTVHPFLIAKFPVTCRQFQAFIEAEDGFKDPRWWLRLMVDIEYHEPSEPHRKLDNHPREAVSWNDSMAFCHWLNARLKWAEISTKLSKDTWETFNGIRLLVEWEWQWAATSGNSEYEYPWGPEWDGSKANTSESGLGHTTAVGMYLAGAAACGTLDMSGNVFEWCLNEYRIQETVELMAVGNPVTRGGGWSEEEDSAGVCHRTDSEPHKPLLGLGFRVVMRPPSL